MKIRKLGTCVVASVAMASAALAGTVDGPGMLANVPGSLKPMLAHWPTPGSVLGAGAPWAYPGLPASKMEPQIILFSNGVSTFNYMGSAYSRQPDLGMCWNTVGGPIPPAANLPSSTAVTWTGFGTGPAYAYHPVGAGAVYPGAIPFHNDGPNAAGAMVPRYTVGAIPNGIVFPTRAAAFPFAGSDEAQLIYSPVNGKPMTLDFVEVENLTYRKYTNSTALIESCSVYRNGARIATFLHQSTPAATITSFGALHPGAPVGPSGPANATMRTPPAPNAFTLCRISPGTVVNSGDKIVIRYDDFGFNISATDQIIGVIPVPPAGKNGNGWAFSAISGHQ